MGTVPTPLDWVANAGLSPAATAFQAGVGDCLTFLLNPPKSQVRRTTAQTITTGTATAIAFDAEDDPDNDSMHSTVTNTTRLTAATAGRYEVSGAIPYDAGATGSREARIVKNGVGNGVNGGRIILPAPASGGIVVVVPTIEVSMAAGDWLELVAFHSQGASLTTTAVNSIFPVFRARWVGP